MSRRKLKRFRNVLITTLIAVAMGLSYLIFTQPSMPYLTVIGHVKMCDGIGRQTTQLLQMLHGELEIGFCPTRETDFTDVPSELFSIIANPNKRPGKVVIYESSLPNPNAKIYRRLNKFLHGPKRKDQIRIAYSMSEADKIPELWAKVLNEYFDAVAVPDECLIEVYQSSGVNIPIFLIPLSIELEPFLKEPLKTKAHMPFCFVNLSSMVARKNHEGVIKAFHLAFNNDPAVQLLLNYRYSRGDALENVQHLLKDLGATNIFLTNDSLNNEEYLHFLQRGDVFITLSKGEGFSIQPREAFALGLPVILSDNTAHKTIIASGLATAISCPTREPCFDAFKKCICGQEYIADIPEAAKKMREVRAHYQKHLENASKRREWVKQYSCDNLRATYLQFLSPKKVILGERNEVTSEGIVTTSKELVAKWDKIIRS